MFVRMHQNIQAKRSKKQETINKLREKTLMKEMKVISIDEASAHEKSVKGDDRFEGHTKKKW